MLINILAYGNNINLYGTYKASKFMTCLEMMWKNGLNF